MKFFIKGQRAKLTEMTDSNLIEILFNVKFRTFKPFDFSCFCVDSNDNLFDENYFIFYNQKVAPDNSIIYIDSSTNKGCFRIDLDLIPKQINKLVLTASLYESNTEKNTMDDIEEGCLSLNSNNVILAKYNFEKSITTNANAIIIAQLYFKECWRFAAVGQGFSSGLSGLVKYFNGEVENSEKTIGKIEQPIISEGNHNECKNTELKNNDVDSEKEKRSILTELLLHDGKKLKLPILVNDKEKLILCSLYKMKNLSTNDIEKILKNQFHNAGLVDGMIKRLDRKLKAQNCNFIDVTVAGELIYYNLNKENLDRGGLIE